MSDTFKVGNLTRDPELTFTQGGQARVTFGIAENNRKKNEATGQWEDGEPAFFDVVAWGSLGENLSECLSKGTRVVVVGRLTQRSWEDREGEKRSRVEIVADEVGPSLRWATAEVTRKAAEGNGKAKASSGGGGGYR